MTTYYETSRRFYRNKDRACIAGVCAGIAERFGFNLCVTRLLAVIALFAVFPLALFIYFAIVFLTPSAHDPERQPRRRRRRRYEREYFEEPEPAPRPTMADVRAKFRTLDERLARLERYVTSPRYDLDEEFRRL